MAPFFSFKNPGALRSLNVLLALLAVAGAAILARDLSSLGGARAPFAAPPLAGTGGDGPARASRLSDYSPLFKANPFGFEAGELKALSAATSAGARAAADIVLLGTVVGADGFGYAVLSRPGAPEELFRTGRQVWDLGVLKSVEKERALIALPGGGLVEASMRDGAERPAAAVGAPVNAAPARDAGQGGAVLLDRTRVAQALERMGDIMTDARLTPRMVDGRQQGFIVNDPTPGGIFQRLGIVDGDAVLTVNGLEINDPEGALQAFGALKNADRVNLGVIRNNSRITMTYKIR